MSGHTRGPWDVQLHSGVSANGCSIVSLTDTVTVARLPRNADRPYPQKEADARLIAAAPEMLDTLKAICLLLGNSDHVDDKLCELAEAAIAKAEGR
jgi:hypothetical protein